MNENWINAFFGDDAVVADLGPAPQSGELAAKTSMYDSPDAVRQALADFGGKGWICFTDRVETHEGSTLAAGIPLSAELVNGDESLHARQMGGQWRVIHLERKSQGSDIIFSERFARLPRGEMIYEVAWRPNENGEYEPQAARFVGMTEES